MVYVDSSLKHENALIYHKTIAKNEEKWYNLAEKLQGCEIFAEIFVPL